MTPKCAGVIDAEVGESMCDALQRRDMRGGLDWISVMSLANAHGPAATRAALHLSRRTALHAAAEADAACYVSLLLTRGADPRARCCAGFTPLLLAAVRGSAGAVLAFVRHSPEPSKGEVRLAMALARFVGHERIVKMLDPEVIDDGSMLAVGKADGWTFIECEEGENSRRHSGVSQ
jgi:hypothetical protein